MAWSLDSVVIHPGGGEDEMETEALYAFQHVLDAAVETISYYGAGSERRRLSFILDENENSGTGRTSLRTKVKTDANVALTSDQGSEGNYRILRLRAVRLMATNKTLPVYRCQVEMVSVSV